MYKQRDIFYKVQIPVPTLAVQEEMVEKCEKIDELIDVLERHNEQTKVMADAVLKTYVNEACEE